eukprot:5011468-Pyramimonas_sp.AAC.1
MAATAALPSGAAAPPACGNTGSSARRSGGLEASPRRTPRRAPPELARPCPAPAPVSPCLEYTWH